MKQLFYFILSTTLISSSCNKEKQSQNYFKCKVDGQEYVPDNCANCVSKTILGDTVLLLGGNTGFKAIAIGINDNSGIKATQYLLNDVIGRRGTYKFSVTPNDRYDTDATHTGQLNIISLDKTNKIIEGTFYYEAYNPLQNKAVSVTEGKFRLQYNTN